LKRLSEVDSDSDDQVFNHQIAQVEDVLKQTASESIIHSAVRDAVADLDFCVTIADPLSEDTHLIAVSEGFERITGYSSEEILGRNCRFLNDGCDLEPWQRMGLRVASKTGALFSAVIINRKKSGELFKNLLNVRGLVIAKKAVTGEDIWVLIGIQADVSNVDDVPVNQLTDVAKRIRRKLVRQFALLGTSAVFRSQGSDNSETMNEWRLVPDGVWREGAVSQDTPQGSLRVATDDNITPSARCGLPLLVRGGSDTPPTSPRASGTRSLTDLIVRVGICAVAAASVVLLVRARRGLKR
jgi:PAS domain S-box-containing protein